MKQDETISVINDMCGQIAKRVLQSLPNFPEHWGPDHVRACVWLAVNRHYLDLRGEVNQIRQSPVYSKLYI